MKKLSLLFYLLLLPLIFQAQITINFCPVTKTQALPKGFSSTISITNNTGVVLDLANNNFNMDWPSLISLPWPFSDGVQTGINWDFKINLDWPGTLAVGATSNVNVNDAKFSGVLQFPTSGTFEQDGTTYTVTVNHCNKTDAFELYDKSFEFDRECFMYSPTSNMCLGEAASEIWDGEGIFDAAVPQDRPSWGIGVMVAHRLFTNLTKLDMVSPNFWTATALNESRMTCDPTITPDVKSHWGINTQANLGTGIDNRTDNCFQVLNIGYVQLENNQPDLFAQTNAFGTADFNSVISGGRWETGALAVTYYHYQNIQYWNQIKCLNLLQVDKDANDPYATEKVLYHAFHDGFNSGTTLIEDIRSNYDAAINATNMNDVIGTGGTWANLGGGSSQKVANFTSLLDGNGAYPYPTQATDLTTEYYGCYEESIKWSDILYYLDKVKILYPQLMDVDVQNDIKAVFDGLNGGGDVLFSNLGPVIDEIVIQMGGHDPSSYLATQYSASKDCPQNPVGVSLRTNDTLCPGESGHLQVWLSGDPNFEVHIKFPDNSIRQYTNITSSPYNIEIDQPGTYEVVYFEDVDEIGDINCNFAKINVESKNGSIVGWDKTNLDLTTNCSTGDLIIEKTGDEDVTITYTKDGVEQTPILVKANEDSKTILTNAESGTYIITDISPNNCGTEINDTIIFCSSCIKPSYSILTPDTSVCEGDTAWVRMSFNGTPPYTIYYNLDGVEQTPINFNLDNLVLPIWDEVTVNIDSIKDFNCLNDTIKSFQLTLNGFSSINLGNDTTICETSTITLDAGLGLNYLWNNGENTQTIDVTTSGEYWVNIDNNGCISSDTINIETEICVLKTFDSDTFYICKGDTLTIQANNVTTEIWSGDDFTQLNDSTIIVSPTKTISKYYLGNESGFIRGDNIIINGDFENGNEGITTQYTENCTSTLGAGKYCVSTNPKSTHGGFATCGDHTSGSGNMFVANGASILNHKIWCQTINLDKNTDYEFSAWLTDVVGMSPPIFQFQIDGSLLGSTLNVTEPKCTWQQYAAIWNSGENVTTEICLINQNTAGMGNDFAIDDIEFVPVYPTSDNSDSVVVVLLEPNKIDLGNDTSICLGDSITLDAGLNNSYKWSTNEITQTIKVDTTGEYSVTITDSNGCKSSDTINLLVNELPIINLGNDTSICLNDSIVLDSKIIASDYLWNNNETTNFITVKDSGQYWVKVTDNLGCSNSDTIELTINDLPIINLGNDTSICLNDSIDISIDGFDSYLWTNGETSNSINIKENGEYWVKVTDNLGCSNSDTINLLVNDLPIINLGNDTSICLNDSIDLSIDGFDSYLWINGETTKSILVNESGQYWVKVTDNLGCSNSDTIELTVNDLPIINLGNDTSICLGDDITLTANDNVGYLWNNGETTKSILVNVSGQYWVKVTDNLGCSSFDTLNLTVNDLPIINLGNDTLICLDDDLMLTANDNVKYLWSTGETTQSILVNKNGNYSVTVYDNIDCESTDDINIDLDSIEDLFNDKEKLLCLNDSITLKPDNFIGYNISWNGVEDSIKVNYGGTYIATVSNENCSKDFEIIVTSIDTPDVYIFNKMGKNEFCFDYESVELEIRGENLIDINNNWQPGGRGNSILIDSAGTYLVYSSGDNCTSVNQITLTEKCNKQLFIPNAFTPNDDNTNDVFKPILNYITDYEMRIYNRWGELIFFTNDLNNGWDGTYMGNECQTDVYVYMIEYSYDNGFGKAPNSIIGRVSLIR